MHSLQGPPSFQKGTQGPSRTVTFHKSHIALQPAGTLRILLVNPLNPHLRETGPPNDPEGPQTCGGG